MSQQQLSPPGKPNKALMVVIALLTLIILVLLFKSPLPAPPAGPLPLPPQPDQAIGVVKQKSGKIISYKYNAHFDINSLQLQTKTDGLISVDFLPHTATKVMQTGAVGQMVKLEITSRPNDEQVGYRLVSIKNAATDSTFVMNELPPPPDVPGQLIENFNIANPVLVTDNYGGIVALRKGDLFFHFKPGLVDDIAGQIKASKLFGIQAVRRGDQLGFVNVKHDRVYIVLSLHINNKTFLVR